MTEYSILLEENSGYIGRLVYSRRTPKPVYVYEKSAASYLTMWPTDAFCDILEGYRSLIRIEPKCYRWGDGKTGPVNGLFFVFTDHGEAVHFKLTYA